MYAFRKMSDAFRQRWSWWRPLTECTRRFPEGIRSFILFPIFYDIYRVLTGIVEVHWTPVALRDYDVDDNEEQTNDYKNEDKDFDNASYEQ